MEGRRLESVPEHPTLSDQDTCQRTTKVNQVTASQQISLWLMRASTQDLGRKMVRESIKPGRLRKCETEVKFRIESDQEEEEENGTQEKTKKKKKKKKKQSKSFQEQIK